MRLVTYRVEGEVDSMDGVLPGLIAGLAACGFLGGFVAGAKGRNFLEGLMLGGLLGPLGVVVAVLMPTASNPAAASSSLAPIGPAPGLVRPRRDLSNEHREITDAATPRGWAKYENVLTGEVFYAAAPPPAPVPPPAPRWTKPLRGPAEDPQP